MTDLRSVAERLETTELDLTAAHDLCLRGIARLADKLLSAFPTPAHPAAERFANFADEGGNMRGSIKAYSGTQLDWVIHSWIGSPQRGFTNHHLTVWLPPTIKAPHLGMAIGTIPQLFFFTDFVPRSDLWVDTAALDRDFAPLNSLFLEVTERFAPFVSKDTYIRQAMSPIGVCKMAEPTLDTIEDALGVFEKFLDRWIAVVREAEQVPEQDQAALAARDRRVRETICHRDPANIIAERVLGKETTDQLVATLAGTIRSER